MTAWRRFARFNAVSAVGIGVQLVAIWALTAMGMHYLPATALSVASAVVHNFAWHRRWTWSDRVRHRGGWAAQLARFWMANGLVSLAGNLVVMAVLVSALGVPPLAANVAAIVCCGLVNYWLGDRFVFRLHPVAHSAP
jgi:dolichol-phosphate mannosyltransferase